MGSDAPGARLARVVGKFMWPHFLRFRTPNRFRWQAAPSRVGEEMGTLKTGTPRKLFDTGLRPEPNINQYVVTEDGLKFLVLEPRKVP